MVEISVSLSSLLGTTNNDEINTAKNKQVKYFAIEVDPIKYPSTYLIKELELPSNEKK